MSKQYHRGELTPDSQQRAKDNGADYVPHLTCTCGATVLGVRDMNDGYYPYKHVIAGTREPYQSNKNDPEE
jgi:hypothetical protein